MNRIVPEGFDLGPIQSRGIIGDVTESIHRFILDGWTSDEPPPRLEEDLSFVPKDREHVIYIYMYRATENQALKNRKRFRPTPFTIPDEKNPEDTTVYYEWPPLYLELYYIIAAHAKFRSDAERMLGWVMLRLHQATHLLYRPRRYVLPDGREVDSSGQPWATETEDDEVWMEKVSLALVDDLTIGDAINFFTIHEAPFRPYATYRANCAMRGPMVSAPPTIVRSHPLEVGEPEPPKERKNGRLGRLPLIPNRKRTPFGPEGYGVKRMTDSDTEDNPAKSETEE